MKTDGFTYIDGAAVYLFTNQSPKRITFDYPSYNVADGYGHLRGCIINALAESGDFQQKDAKIRFEYVNFQYDQGSLAADSMYLYNAGKKDGRNESYGLAAGRIDYYFHDSSGIYTFSFDEEITVMKYGNTMYTHPDDSLAVFGNFHGNTVRNTAFDAANASDSSFLFSYGCRWLRSGVIRIETEMFDFPVSLYMQDADSCENGFQIVIDGEPFPSLTAE